MAHATNNGMSANSEHELDTPAVSPGAYAPSPNTSSQALSRANQLRVQNLLRRLLLEPEESIRIDTLRVLRKTLREIDFRLSWLTQVDFLETMERVLRNETQGLAKAGGENQDQEQQQQQQHNGLDTSWRLLHDATQLLIESLSRFEHELERQTVESIVPSVVENLGHSRSEVRRASLLLLNQMLNERPQHFELIVRLFVDYGLTNHRNKQAQRGSILSLPLLINETIVERGEDLTPVVRCLSELLMIDSNEQLFYSLFLAMQRIHMMIGDGQFQAILRRHCEPEAAHLYRQAVSRSNSLVAPSESLSRPETDGAQRDSSARKDSQQQLHATSKQHVTFEASADAGEEEQAPGGVEAEPKLRDLKQSQQEAEQLREGRLRSDSQLSTATTASELTSESCSAALNPEGKELHGQEQQQEEDENPLDHHPAVFQGRKFSSDVSSTCSSDAHLVNPAHYMTKAALSGHPLDHYEEIHHIDHSNINGLAINDFGPICNTPTIELFQSQLPSSIHFRPGASTDTPAANLLLLSSSSELKFGIFPKQLIQVTLQSPRPSDRYEAMQELMCIVRESPVNHLAILMTYFDSFLEQFLAKVLLPHHQAGASSKQPTSLHQSDCKLELIAIDMIETIIVKTKVSTMQYIRPIVGLLMRALVLDSQRQPGGRSAGPVQPHAPDPSSSSLTSSAGQHQQQLAALSSAPGIFRENACRVIHKMMAYLPPQHVIDAIFEHKHQRAAVVREEAINRVTAAILEYDRNEFNLTKLCYHVLPMLADHSATVRLASLECIATLAHVLGPERIGSLLTAAEAVQTGCDYDGLLDAINARLLRHTLPRCQSNGIVRYALKPLLLSHQHLGSQTELAADVRWVLESPSLHQHSHTGHTMKDGCDEHHHHHRLGVYSPPSQAERRRRSSVGLALLEHPEELRQQQQRAVGGHQHHHSLRRHRSTSVINQQQQEQDEDDPKAHHQAKQGDMSSR